LRLGFEQEKIEGGVSYKVKCEKKMAFTCFNIIRPITMGYARVYCIRDLTEPVVGALSSTASSHHQILHQKHIKQNLRSVSCISYEWQTLLSCVALS